MPLKEDQKKESQTISAMFKVISMSSRYHKYYVIQNWWTEG
jgi:hypothetical protein